MTEPIKLSDSAAVQAPQETLGAARASIDAENGRSLPKIEPLPGNLQAEMKTCGKPTCHCASGELHGPYWSHRWREAGRQRRRYVRPRDLAAVRAGIQAWRQLHPPVRSMRDRLRELRRLLPQLEKGA